MILRFWQANGPPASVPKRLGESGRHRWLVRYASAVALVVCAIALVALVRACFGFPPFLFLAAAMCIDAVGWGMGPGICALILATIASDFFFIEPTLAFSLNRQVWALSIANGCGAIVTAGLAGG